MDGEALASEVLELPSPAERERLLTALGHLVRKRGLATLLHAPLLLPRGDYFPDRWEPSVRGARILLKRLLHYTGLGTLGVDLSPYRERLSGLTEDPDARHAAAWFAGIEDGICRFGLDTSELRHEDTLVAALAHEVAHAYREHHGLVVVDREVEERLTDLTTVYLGFGVFALNASWFFKTGGYSEDGQPLLYERRALGYLAPAELALLLAAQVVVRRRGSERRGVREALADNHAFLFDKACRELSGSSAELDALLGVPAPEHWPPAPTPEPLPPLEFEAEAPSAPGSSEAERGVAFRVESTRAPLFALGGLAVAGAAGVLFELSQGLFWAAALGSGALGYVSGTRLRCDECSGCRARLFRDAEHCASCGARIVFAIRSHEERLQAEEDYAAIRRKEAGETADPPEENEDELAKLMSAMLVAWGLRAGHIAPGARDELVELARRVERDDYDSEALWGAWRGEADLFAPEVMRFAEYYQYEAPALRQHDLAILTTANDFRDTPGNYRRFFAVVDRRFNEWRKRGSD